jgi:hypothetical protein
LPITDRWRLVQSLLSSIQKETSSNNVSVTGRDLIPEIDPWTQSLVGVIQLGAEDPTEAYVDYLVEKYS